MRLSATAYEPPVLDGYTFWSVFSSDESSKRAILDDDAGRAYTIAKTAGDFDVPLDDVRAELFRHPHYGRLVWHAYLKDIHKAKVIYQLEHLELLLRALKRTSEIEGW